MIQFCVQFDNSDLENQKCHGVFSNYYIMYYNTKEMKMFDFDKTAIYLKYRCAEHNVLNKYQQCFCEWLSSKKSLQTLSGNST